MRACGHSSSGSNIRMPEDVLFIPQQPLLPRRCTLRGAVCYPQPEDTFTDEAIRQALEQVSLQRLLDVKHFACSGEDEAEEEEDEGEDDEDEDEDEDEDAEEDEDVNRSKGSRGSDDISEADESPHGEGPDREDNWMLRKSPGMRRRLALAARSLAEAKAALPR